MQQLTAADSMFLSMEQPECPMNMGLLIMLEGPYSAENIDQLMIRLKAGALHVERHHQRIWPPQFKYDQPYWINDGSLQVSKHVRHHRLPEPRDTQQLHKLVESILMARMDRTQPLWALHLISGLENGQHALIFKMHHACADGISALKMFAETVADPDTMLVSWPPKEHASRRQLQWRSVRNLARRPLRLAINLLGLAAVRLAAIARLLPSGKQPNPHASRFTSNISEHRSYACCSFSLSSVRTINRKFGSSENEVLMSLYSAALRRYLLEHNELPAASLHAGMPVSMMFSRERKDAANQAGFIRITLATLIDDPVERLQAMKARCARALTKKPSRGYQRLTDLMLNAPPRLVALASQAYVRLLRSGHLQSRYSAITTYMPGPARAIDLAGYRIKSVHPLGVLFHGCGLSISAMRYNNAIHCGIAADRRLLPDPDVLITYMQEELNTLYQCATTTP